MYTEGWRLFRPEAYELKLMEKNDQGEIVNVDGDDWVS